MRPIDFLRLLPLGRRFMRPAALLPGMVFELGSPATPGECRWRVRTIQEFLGIPHAMIEHMPSGKAKTVAVSTILQDPTFKVGATDANS